MGKWLLLIYKIPREPTAHRVSVWRKLKQLGALLLHDAVWVLPATPRTTEQFQWLASEITELGGEALVWISELTVGSQEHALVDELSLKVDSEYEEILGALRKKKPDLASLGRKYQQVSMQDYFQSKLGVKVRKMLLAKGEKSQ